MASPVKIRQRVSLDSTGRYLQVQQNQNGRVRNALIPLAERTRGTRNLHNITDYAGQWPKTELDVTTPEFEPNIRTSSE